MDQEIDAGKGGELNCMNEPAVCSDAQNFNYF